MMNWNDRYAEEGFAYGTEPNDFLKTVVPQLPKGRALCLAEGEGRNAVFLAEQGYDVLAVDQSEVGLRKAETLAAQRGQTVQTRVSDLADFRIQPDTWDVIVSIWAHVPPPLRKSLHAQCISGLKSGGMLVLEAYTPDQVGRGTGGPPSAELTMSLSALRQELPNLTFVRAEELVRDVHEGKYHNGTSAVVQLLARKD